jgi:hypothetical protein
MSDPEASLGGVDGFSIDSELKFRFANFVDKLRDWYGDGVDNGTFRFSVSQTSDGHRLDCWYQNKSPAWFAPTSQETTRLSTTQLEVFRESDVFVEGISTASGEFLTLTAVLTTRPPTAPKWGCWWNSLGTVCGDLWGFWSFDEADTFLISDGLGHGENAAEASRRAAESIEEKGDEPVDVHLKAIHKKLQTTRGAVLFLGRIPVESNNLEFCSIGNIFVKVIGGITGKGLVSFNGTVGFGDPHIEVQSLSLDDVTQLVLHTDGVEPSTSSFYSEPFRESSPVMNAARVLSAFGKGNDDALVGVVDL